MKRYLLVGLGNPGPDYAATRHNAGWLVLDELVRLWSEPGLDLTWHLEKKLQAAALRLNRDGREIMLLKPQTFMNQSGQAVAAAVRWLLNLDTTVADQDFPNLIICHDDLDLTTGQYKLQFNSGPKIHNGVNSVRQELHSNRFWLSRFGVDSRGGQRTIPGQAYVLQSLNPSEKQALNQAVRTWSEELSATVLQ